MYQHPARFTRSAAVTFGVHPGTVRRVVAGWRAARREFPALVALFTVLVAGTAIAVIAGAWLFLGVYLQWATS